MDCIGISETVIRDINERNTALHPWLWPLLHPGHSIHPQVAVHPRYIQQVQRKRTKFMTCSHLPVLHIALHLVDVANADDHGVFGAQGAVVLQPSLRRSRHADVMFLLYTRQEEWIK